MSNEMRTLLVDHLIARKPIPWWLWVMLFEIHDPVVLVQMGVS